MRSRSPTDGRDGPPFPASRPIATVAVVDGLVIAGWRRRARGASTSRWTERWRGAWTAEASTRVAVDARVRLRDRQQLGDHDGRGHRDRHEDRQTNLDCRRGRAHGRVGCRTAWSSAIATCLAARTASPRSRTDGSRPLVGNYPTIRPGSRRSRSPTTSSSCATEEPAGIEALNRSNGGGRVVPCSTRATSSAVGWSPATSCISWPAKEGLIAALDATAAQKLWEAPARRRAAACPPRRDRRPRSSPRCPRPMERGGSSRSPTRPIPRLLALRSPRAATPTPIPSSTPNRPPGFDVLGRRTPWTRPFPCRRRSARTGRCT